MSYSGGCGFAVRCRVALAGAIFVAAAWPAAAQNDFDRREGRGSIRQFQRLSAEEGWVLTDDALLFTRNGGASWSDLAAGDRFEGVTDAHVLSASEARLAAVSPSSPGSLVVFETSDGGASWRERSVHESELAAGHLYSRARVVFLDAAHGWLLGQVATSSAFSVAELLRTTDGGASWERLPRPPAAGRFLFVDSEHGYMTGAPVSERLYVTRDGGRSWSEVELAVPTEIGMALYDLPTFHSPELGTLAVTLRGEDPRVLVFVTPDGGSTWRSAGSTPLPPGDYDEPAPVALGKGGELVAVAAQGLVKFVRGAAPQAVRVTSREDSTPRATGATPVSVRRLAVSDDSPAWALVAEGGCEDGICRQVTRLVAVGAPGPGAEEGQLDLLVRNLEEPQPEKKSRVVSAESVISYNYGFDKCAAGTTTQMQTWWDSSPYWDANIYYGGAARACSQVNLDASWMSTVFEQGWRLIPTWVGPQAPCTGFSARFSSDPVQARNDGLAEADAAVAGAAALDLGVGTPLYYDLELYAENDAACSEAVRAFVNAWTERVNEHGYVAGVYGNARNAQADWRSGVIANPPDAVWLVPWVCSAGTSSCNWTPTVFGIPGLDDAYWANDQRIRQYWGDHTETHGGVTFSIDSDYANGPVATAGTSSSCSESVPAGHWRGEYFANQHLGGSAVMVRDDGTGFLDFDWSSGSPDAACVSADDFSVRWMRSVELDGGTYRFHITSDDGFRLYVDGGLELEAWKDQGPTDYSVDVSLAAGSHALELQYYENGGLAVAKLSWERVADCIADVPSTAWKGEYFDNMDLSGSPVMVRNDGTGFIDFGWYGDSPSPECGFPADRFSVRWTRSVTFDGGTYRFDVTSDDGFRLSVDGNAVLQAWKDQGPTDYTVEVPLAAGDHSVELEYYENGGWAVARLSWTAVSTGGDVFDWPVGRTRSGEVVPGHGVSVLQNYRNRGGAGWYDNRYHAGIDLDFRDGNDAGQWVYSTADGVVRCVANSDTLWYPGAVVVVEHELDGNQTVFSMYGHLNDVDLSEGQALARGAPVGTILDQAGNSHLHFEVRDWLYDPESGTCWGPGYAYLGIGDGTPESQGWRDPVDEIFGRPPAFPTTVVTDVSMNVRSEPRLGAPAITTLAPDSEFEALRVLPDSDGAEHWWYEVLYDGQSTGFVAGFYHGGWDGEVYLGEERSAGADGCVVSVPTTSWKGEYFDNMELAGSPSMVRNDGTGFLDFGWYSDSPSPACGFPADGFSVRWTRSVTFDGGTYRFDVTSDDGFRLSVDGNTVLQAWKDQGPTDYGIEVLLAAGSHDLELEYYENGGWAVAELSWVPVSTGPTVVVVDDLSSGFSRYGPAQYWWEASIGYSDHMYWTYVNGSVLSNYARWTPNLSSGGAGNYDVYVFVPFDNATSRQARYRIRHNGVDTYASVDQSVFFDQWVFIGSHYFAAGGGEYVELADATGEPGSSYLKIGFDAVRLEK